MQDRFIDTSTVSSLHNITAKIGALIIGIAGMSAPMQLTARMWPLVFR